MPLNGTCPSSLVPPPTSTIAVDAIHRLSPLRPSLDFLSSWKPWLLGSDFEPLGVKESKERKEVRSSARVFLMCRNGAMAGRQTERTSMAGSTAVQLQMDVYPTDGQLADGAQGVENAQVISSRSAVTTTTRRTMAIMTDLRAS